MYVYIYIYIWNWTWRPEFRLVPHSVQFLLKKRNLPKKKGIVPFPFCSFTVPLNAWSPLCWKNAVQKGFLYVTKYSQNHAQKIQLTKEQKATIGQPPHKNSNLSLRQGQHPLGHLFVSRYQLVIPQSEKNWKPMLQTTRFCLNNMW